MNAVNSFEKLGIEPNASKDEIRKAYRALARRWHPDRFMQGPERDWANEKMAEINAAYRECLDGTGTVRVTTSTKEDDALMLEHAQKLVDLGEYTEAANILRKMALRSDRWNWLFGRILLAQNKRERAILYLQVAVNQKPDNKEYLATLNQAKGAESLSLLQKIRLRMK